MFHTVHPRCLTRLNTDVFFVCFLLLLAWWRSVGHKGKFGHEFLEFELSDKGELRYANDSRYRHESIIRKQMCVSPQVVEEFRRIIDESGILEFVLLLSSSHLPPFSASVNNDCDDTLSLSLLVFCKQS